MSMKEIEVLYEALHSEHGIEIELLGNFQMSLQRLHTARRQNPDFEPLQISRSPHSPTHLWLVFADRGPQALTQNPQGEGPLFSLADLLGDD